MPGFGHQIAALLDHLELDSPVVGGTSLGANSTLEFAVSHPNRARALLIEMPVLDDALLGAALAFTPALLGLRFGRPVLKAVAALTSVFPAARSSSTSGSTGCARTPRPRRRCSRGSSSAAPAPPHDEREKLTDPALVVGHPSDPLHPFSDAGMLVEEMRNARLLNASSILEWRISPERLNDELDQFLAASFAEPSPSEDGVSTPV